MATHVKRAVHAKARHPEVVAASVAMLAETGHLDMKQVAAEAGVSRASLYRYYPDRFQLESEIAELGFAAMVAAAAEHEHRRDKLRAAFDFLADQPGYAAAIVAQAATIPASAMTATAEWLTGEAGFAPLIAGIAVMAATPAREPGDREVIAHAVERLLAHID